jgi:Gram-negative bacterial TonB protein C-terminal
VYPNGDRYSTLHGLRKYTARPSNDLAVGIARATTSRRQGRSVCGAPWNFRTKRRVLTGLGYPVTFPRSDFAVFRLTKPPGIVGTPLQTISAKTPTFSVAQETGAFRWWSSLKALCTGEKFDRTARPSYPFHDRTVRKSAFRGRSVSASVAAHFAAVLLIVYAHQAYPENVYNLDDSSLAQEVIYYQPPMRRLPKILPHIVPPGPGGQPMSGSIPERQPAAGSTAGDNLLTIVSNPAHPDNNHQTIIQPSSPPDLRITNDIKLPNLILGVPRAAPKAPLEASAAKPAPANKQAVAADAPAPTMASQQVPMVTFLAPSSFKPAMPVAVNQGAAQRRNSGGTQNVEAPSVDAAATPAPFVTPTRTFTPAMPEGASQGIAKRRSSGNDAGPTEAPDVNAAAAPTASVISSKNFTPAMPVGASQATGQRRNRNSSNGVAEVDAPNVSAAATAPSFVTPSNNFAPAMPVGASRGTAQPNKKAESNGTGMAEAPNVSAAATPAPFVTPSRNFTPAMPGGGTQTAAQPRSRTGGNGASSVEAPSVSAGAMSGDSLTLAALSADPGAPASQIKLPPGNRMGEFAVSEKAGPGSPGGAPAGVVLGGSSPGKVDKGGSGSTGAGPADRGGGGTSLSEAPVAIYGKRESDIASGMLGVALARGIVYPVPIAFNIRRNSFIVSAGPIGGGGLDAYGALQCGKVYSIFLPMPGKDWIMQYCPQSVTASKTPAPPSTVARFGNGIVPPQADTKFDFRRLPVSEDKVRKMIILKGLLRSDGVVDQLEVYQGVLPEMDDDARLAFSQWKFQPALREGKPISVQILVGIPAVLPKSDPAP